MFTHFPVIRRAVRAATPALALGTAGLTAALAACADTPTSPTSAAATAVSATAGRGPTRDTGLNGSGSSYVTAQTVSGDTTVTTLVLGTASSGNVRFDIGNRSAIQFFGEASAICDPATSSYGPAYWNSPCTPSKQPVTITAKTWVDRSTGNLRSAFSPALRFVPQPGTKNGSVQLYLHTAGTTPGTPVILFCPDGATTCVNEAATDPSLATYVNQNSQWVYRIIKHFSGYTVSY